MIKIGSRIRTGTAACVIAAAAVLTPAAVAHAQPAAPIPTAGIGAAAVPACVVDPAAVCPPSLSSFAFFVPSGSSSFDPRSIFQNGLIWFGTPNPNPPPQTTVFEFYPLALVPGFLQPLFGWFSNVNFEACVAGLTLRIGPYGTVSGSYGRGCA